MITEKFFTIVGKVSLVCLAIVVLGIGAVYCLDAGYQAGYQEGAQEGVAVTLRRFDRIANAPAVADPSGKPAKGSIEEAKEYWEPVEFGKKTFLYSQYAAPPLLNTFGIEEAYNYFYCFDGVFAFPVDAFTFQEIYELILNQPAPPPPKTNWGGSPQKI